MDEKGTVHFSATPTDPKYTSHVDTSPVTIKTLKDVEIIGYSKYEVVVAVHAGGSSRNTYAKISMRNNGANSILITGKNIMAVTPRGSHIKAKGVSLRIGPQQTVTETVTFETYLSDIEQMILVEESTEEYRAPSAWNSPPQQNAQPTQVERSRSSPPSYRPTRREFPGQYKSPWNR